MTARTIPVDTFDYLVFGGTGDLSLRKLLPALYLRDKAGQITGGSRIVGVSRTRMDPAAYRENAERALRQFLPAGEFDARTWERFSARLSYAAVDATSDDGWDSLARHLDGRDDVIRVFYLATSPSLFGPIAERLRAFDLVTPKSRVVLEKPIGHDLASAMHINEQVGGVFAEEQIIPFHSYSAIAPFDAGIGVGASRRVTAIFSISKSLLLLMPVGMGAKVSISPFPDPAREAGERCSAQPSSRCPGHCSS